MLAKFLKWLTDYQSGRFIITFLVILVTWVLNLIQFILMVTDGEVMAKKVFIVKTIGLVPPFNLLTVWF